MVVLTNAAPTHAASLSDLTLSFDAQPPFSEFDTVQPGTACLDGAPVGPARPVAEAFTRERVPANVRHGTYSAKLVIRPQDHAAASCEEDSTLAIASTGEGEGDTSWWAWSMKFPADYAGAKGWGTLLEFVPPSWLWPNYGMLSLDAGSADTLTLVWHTGLTPDPGSGSYHSAYEQRVALLGPEGAAPHAFAKDRWLDFYLHVVWKSRAEGVCELWYREEGQAHFTKLYSNRPDGNALIQAEPHPTLLYNKRHGAPGEENQAGLRLVQGFSSAATPWVRQYWIDGLRRRATEAAILAEFPDLQPTEPAPESPQAEPASSPEPEAVKPTLISSISAGSTLSGVVAWSVTAPKGTLAVEFWVDGTKLVADRTAPFAISLDTNPLRNGPHHLGLVWLDNAGMRQAPKDSIEVSVENTNAPPAIVQSISAGQTLSGIVAWSATPLADVQNIEFFCSGQSLGTRAGAPYAVDFDTTHLANGPHVLGLTVTLADGTVLSDPYQIGVVTISNLVTQVTQEPLAGKPVPGAPEAAISAGGLAPNPSFESDPHAEYTPYGGASFSWASDAAHTGARSLKVASSQVSNRHAAWASRITAIQAKPGTTYAATVFAKTDKVSQKALLILSFWDSASRYLLSSTVRSQPISGTADWTQLSVSGVAPSHAAFARIEFQLHGPGTLWVDDVYLIASGGSDNVPNAQPLPLNVPTPLILSSSPQTSSETGLAKQTSDTGSALGSASSDSTTSPIQLAQAQASGVIAGSLSNPGSAPLSATSTPQPSSPSVPPASSTPAAQIPPPPSAPPVTPPPPQATTPSQPPASTPPAPQPPVTQPSASPAAPPASVPSVSQPAPQPVPEPPKESTPETPAQPPVEPIPTPQPPPKAEPKPEPKPEPTPPEPPVILPGQLAVATHELSDATVNELYVAHLTALGGSSRDATWEIVQGELPDGLVLHKRTGLIIGRALGTLSAPTPSDFTVRITDSAGAVAEESLRIVVNPAGYPSCFLHGPQRVPVAERFVVHWSHTAKLRTIDSLGWRGPDGQRVMDCDDTRAVPDCADSLHRSGELAMGPPAPAQATGWGWSTALAEVQDWMAERRVPRQVRCDEAPDQMTCNGIWLTDAGPASLSIRVTNTLGGAACSITVVGEPQTQAASSLAQTP